MIPHASTHAVWVVASGDEQPGGGVVADPVDLEQRWCDLADQRSHLDTEALLLLAHEQRSSAELS